LIGVNEKKNLRFILATFYEVWTCDAIWRNVSMQSLIEDESIVKVGFEFINYSRFIKKL